MAPRRKGLHEKRTRVTCNLPVNNVHEEKAFVRVLAYLDELRLAEIGVSGYMHSQLRMPVFHGYWWPDGAVTPVHDYIVVCTIDYRLDFDSPKVSTKIKELKQTIRKWYRHYGSPQDEIWVIAHPVLRQD